MKLLLEEVKTTKLLDRNFIQKCNNRP